MGIISRLISEGALLIYHDYRSGTFRDFSGNGNHGTPTSGMELNKSGAWLSGSTDQIEIADNAALRPTEMSIVILGEIRSQTTTERLFNKRDAGGAHIQWYTSSTALVLVGNGAAKTIVTDVKNTRCIASNIKSGEAAEAFVNGMSVGNYGGTVDITANDAPIIIGNLRPLASQPCQSKFEAVIMTNRRLTDGEHMELYQYLKSSRPDTRGIITTLDSSGDRYCQSLGNGARVTTSNLSAGQQVPGTPFYVSSGTWSVGVETVNGKPSKVLTCETAGIAYADWGELRNNDSEAAYGTWEWWIYKANASTMNIALVAASNSALTAGDYLFEFDSSENLALVEQGTGDVITGGTATADAWHEVKVTRSAVGSFELIVDGSSEGTGSDATTTEADYLTIDLDAGDKLALSTLSGEPMFKKYYGVV